MQRFLTALIAALFFMSTPALAVPVQWTVASGGNGHFYESVASSNSLSWNGADAAATMAGGYLVTVTSAAEQAFLESLSKPSGAYWAGGQDLASEGTWKWVTGPEAGDLFIYTNWFAGEPNNSNNEDYLSWNQSSGGGPAGMMWVSPTLRSGATSSSPSQSLWPVFCSGSDSPCSRVFDAQVVRPPLLGRSGSTRT